MDYERTSEMEHHAGWSGLWSGLMIFAGVLAIAVPWVAGVAVTALVGWLLIVSGILHLAFAWRGAHGAACVGVPAGSSLRTTATSSSIRSPGWRRWPRGVYLFLEGLLELVLSACSLRRRRGVVPRRRPGDLVHSDLIATTWPSARCGWWDAGQHQHAVQRHPRLLLGARRGAQPA